MTKTTLYDGEWCDVDFSPVAGWVFARLVQPKTLVVIVNGAERARIDIGGWGLYLRCAIDHEGSVCCVWQDHATGVQRSVTITSHGSIIFGENGPKAPAQNAVDVVRRESGIGFDIYVQTSDRTAQRNGATYAIQPTSQGFADAPELKDNVFRSVPGLAELSRAGELVLGQRLADPPRLAVSLRGAELSTVFHGNAGEPRLVQVAPDRWLGCARGSRGAVLLELAPPFPADVVDPPQPPRPPVEPPPVTPPQEPVTMKIDPRVYALLRAFIARFPFEPGVSEADVRFWNIRFARQVAFSLPGEGYGLKSTSSTGTIGKDTIARKVGDDVYCWDLLIGAGSGNPKLSPDPAFHNIGPNGPPPDGGQKFRSVDEFGGPLDSLGAGTVPVDPGVPGEGPATPSSDVLERFLAAHLQLVAVVGSIGDLVKTNTEMLQQLAGQSGADVGPVVDQIDALRKDVQQLTTTVTKSVSELKSTRYRVSVGF
jgi:hypothetical protein